METGSYLSIITLNVNGLNAPTKRQRLAEWIQKQDPEPSSIEPGLAMGTHVHQWLSHVDVWQKPPQCCKVIQFSLVAQ